MNINDNINVLNHFFNSIKLNYKTWLLYLIFVTILCDNQILVGLYSLLLSLYICYAGHNNMHNENLYCNLFSIPHNFHHYNTEWYSYFLNCLTEYLFDGFGFIPFYIM
jgi:hypothetical protein